MSTEHKYITNYEEIVNYTNEIYNQVSVKRFRAYIYERYTPICVCGSGNSYVVAKGITKIINQVTGIVTFAKRPRELLYYNCDNLERIIFVSFSNTRTEYEQVKVLSKNSVILSFYADQNEQPDNIAILSRNNAQWNKKVFFNSPQAVMVPIEFVYYSLSNRVINSYCDWQKKFSGLVYNGTFPIRIAVIAGDWCEFAANDLKNKFEESPFGIVDVYEKRDLSHGKFISFWKQEYVKVIYLKQHFTSEYETYLIQYLQSHPKFELMESRHNGIEAEIDLLQAEQTYIYEMCKMNSIDFGNNLVDEFSKKIYKYQGKII